MDSTVSFDEILDDSRVAETVCDDICQSMESEETLESIRTKLETTNVDEKSAELASVAIESIRNQLGMSSSHRIVPATEHFSHSGSIRTSAAFVAAEGIQDFLVEIWKKIKASIKAFWLHVVSIAEKIQAGVFLLEHEVKVLKKRFNDFTSTARPKESSFENPRLAKAFSLNGEANAKTAREMANQLKSLKDFSKKMAFLVATSGLFAVGLGYMHDDLEKVSDLIKKSSADYNQEVEMLSRLLEKYKKVMPSKFQKNIQNYDSAEYFGPFVGQQYLVIAKTNTKLHGLTSESYEVRLQKADVEAKTQIEALNYYEIQTILKHVENTIQDYPTFLKLKPEYQKISNSLQKMSDEIIQTLSNKATSQPVRDVLALLRFQVRNIISTSNTVSNQIPVLTMNAIKAHLDYIRLSINNLQA